MIAIVNIQAKTRQRQVGCRVSRVKRIDQVVQRGQIKFAIFGRSDERLGDLNAKIGQFFTNARPLFERRGINICRSERSAMIAPPGANHLTDDRVARSLIDDGKIIREAGQRRAFLNNIVRQSVQGSHAIADIGQHHSPLAQDIRQASFEVIGSYIGKGDNQYFARLGIGFFEEMADQIRGEIGQCERLAAAGYGRYTKPSALITDDLILARSKQRIQCWRLGQRLQIWDISIAHGTPVLKSTLSVSSGGA